MAVRCGLGTVTALEVCAVPGDGSFMQVAPDGRVIGWSVSAEKVFGWSAQEAVGRHIGELVASVISGECRWTSAIVEALSACSPMIFHVLDAELRIVQVSGVCARKPSYPVSVIGGAFRDVYGLAAPAAEEKVARGVLSTGKPVLDHVVRARLPGDPRTRHYSLSYIRMENLHHDAAGLVVLALDVSDRVRATQRLTILQAVRDRVDEQLDVIAVCRALTGAVVPGFCGIAVVEVIDGVVRGEDPPLAPVDGAVQLLRAAFRGVVSAHPVGEVSRLRHADLLERPLPASRRTRSVALHGQQVATVLADLEMPRIATGPVELAPQAEIAQPFRQQSPVMVTRQ